MFAFGMGPFELLIVLLMAAFLVWPFWRICTKAGFPGWLSLIMLLPGANLIFPFFLAIADWPALRQK